MQVDRKSTISKPTQRVLNMNSPPMPLLIPPSDAKAKSTHQIMLATASMLGNHKTLGGKDFTGTVQTFNIHLMVFMGNTDD